MKDLVNWIPLTINTRSRNTEPPLMVLILKIETTCVQKIHRYCPYLETLKTLAKSEIPRECILPDSEIDCIEKHCTCLISRSSPKKNPKKPPLICKCCICWSCAIHQYAILCYTSRQYAILHTTY